MQNNPFDPSSPYEDENFIPLSGSYSPEPEVCQETPPQQQIPLQSSVGPGVPPAYSIPVQGTPAPSPAANNANNAYYQNAYQPNQPAPFPQQQAYKAPEPPKKSKLNLILGIIVGILALFLIVIAVSQLDTGSSVNAATVSAGTLGSNYTGDALIVRNEVMYTQESISQIEYTATEGALVTRGSDVCTVYTAGFNTKEWTTLDSYRTQIKEYQKTLLAESNTEADSQLKRYNASVLQLAQETQQMIHSGGGNLINQEELLSTEIEERAYYLKQKYADDQKLSRLYDDEKTQLSRIETWTKSFVAADPGIVSFYTDGYERVLSTSNYESYSPSEIRSMYNGNIPDSASLGRNEVAVYRLVRQGSYVVLMLCDDTSWTPTVGASYELLVESFDNTRVSATVESVTHSEGELLVRLSVVGDVSSVLYIRSCHVQLSESIYSLTVPANALTTVDGEIGVVVIQTDGQYFLPVTVIAQDANEAHIVPLLDNILTIGSRVLTF